MFLSGIADEAGRDLDTQIRAHHELGWQHIELRTIDGMNITDVDDATFDKITQRLWDADMVVSCFASQIANWSRPISSDFEIDRAELQRAVPRMQRLGTLYIRCMSYPNSEPPLSDPDWRARVIERMKVLANCAATAGVVLVHENCHGWASQGAEHMIDLLDTVNSPHLKLVFDTGNPICDGQDVWELYKFVRDHIVYLHIKDYTLDDNGDAVACLPGQGRGYVPEIISDLMECGYDGGLSIEPHIESVIHLDRQAENPQIAFRTYIKYGRTLERLLSEVTSPKDEGRDSTQ